MKIIDMHCDTISGLLTKKRAGISESLCENTGHLDIKRLKEQDYLLQYFAMYVNCASCDDPWEEVNALYEVYAGQMECFSDLIAPVKSFSDIAKNKKEGKISALLTVEEGAVCKGDLEKLKLLYDKGVRLITLTWNYENEIGFPAKIPEDKEKGLTAFGRIFVERMEELGMIVDVSHLSDGGFYDVAAIAKKPFVASHSNARSICGNARNLTDDMIHILGEKGGIMGLNFFQDFLTDKKDEDALECLSVHAKHIVSCGGIEVLGLGSDFDGIPDNPYIEGVQSMERVWHVLHKSGFTEEELDKIFYKNVLRVMETVL